MNFLVWLSQLLSTRNENTAFGTRLRGARFEEAISSDFEVDFSLNGESPWAGVLELTVTLNRLVEQQRIVAWHGGAFTHAGLGSMVRFDSFEDARTAIAARPGGVFRNWNK